MGFTDSKRSLNFSDIMTGISFELELRNRITVITGDTATGKTLLVNVLKKYMRDMKNNADSPVADFEFVYIYGDNDGIDSIKNLRNKIIIIDRADIVFSLNSNLVEHIKYDWNNYYVIIARREYNLGISPNSIATLRERDKVISTNYEFDVKGW